MQPNRSTNPSTAISEKQWRGVLGILKVQADSLDINYLTEWAGCLGLVEVLDRAKSEAGLDAGQTQAGRTTAQTPRWLRWAMAFLLVFLFLADHEPRGSLSNAIPFLRLNVLFKKQAARHAYRDCAAG